MYVQQAPISGDLAAAAVLVSFDPDQLTPPRGPGFSDPKRERLRKLSLETRDGRWMLPDHEIVEERTVESYDLWYPRGPLPAYRFVFDNGTRVQVRTTGEVILADRAVQAYHGIVGLHDFSVVGSVFRVGFGHWLLWAASLASIVVIATGYLLAYPFLMRTVRGTPKT